MDKVKINYWLDVLLVILLVVVGVTGLVLEFAFTSGSPGVGRTLTFFGTSKREWVEPHATFGVIMVVLMVIHLILHFNWLGKMTAFMFKRNKK